VPGFLSSRPDWLPAPPHTQASVVPPPLWFPGGHTRLREMGRGDPVRMKGRHSGTIAASVKSVVLNKPRQKYGIFLSRPD
jgi:hypothetical protein